MVMLLSWPLGPLVKNLEQGECLCVKRMLRIVLKITIRKITQSLLLRQITRKHWCLCASLDGNVTRHVQTKGQGSITTTLTAWHKLISTSHRLKDQQG